MAAPVMRSGLGNQALFLCIMSSINYKSIDQSQSDEIQAIEWPSLLDALLSIVLVVILMLAFFMLSNLEVWDLLAIRENQEKVKQSVSHYVKQNYPSIDLDFKTEGSTQTINLPGRLLFAAGSKDLSQNGLVVVEILGRLIAKYDSLLSKIEIVGHTDPSPVRANPFFKDNLDLSCLRAASVVRYLVDKKIIDERKLSAVGRSFYEGIQPNVQSPSQMRRIEFRLLYAKESEKG